MKNLRRQGGFTLLELLLVLTLAAIVVGLSSFLVIGQTLPSARFNATVRELSAALRDIVAYKPGRHSLAEAEQQHTPFAMSGIGG